MLPRGECALLCFDVLAAVDGAVHPVPLRPPTNTLSLEDLRNRVVMPAFTLLFGGNLHGIQESSDSPCANSFAIHLLDGSNGAQFALVLYGSAADFLFAVGIPHVVVSVWYS